MGQYQQWLQLREKEQRLRARLERLETELAELQAQARCLPEPGSYEQNPLLHLLVQAASLHSTPQPHVRAEQSLAAGERPASSSLSAPQIAANEERDAAGATGETPALFPWSGPLNVRVPTVRGTGVPSTPLARPEIELLPEDMASFFDEHTQTSPQVQPPWWMRQPVSTSTSGNLQGSQRHTPADYETLRNNREIERWLERWHRTSDDAEQEGETQHG